MGMGITRWKCEGIGIEIAFPLNSTLKVIRRRKVGSIGVLQRTADTRG